MASPDLASIATQIDARAGSHLIGALQQLRAELRGLTRQSCRKIFSAKTIWEDWAYHHGGRTELQFNIGKERFGEAQELRYGVAFSFETSRSLPSVGVLMNKVPFFNEFLRTHPGVFEDMRMWHYDENNSRSCRYMPAPIPAELVRRGVFVFLGTLQPLDDIDYEAILCDFDRLLGLYTYVESQGRSQPIPLAFTGGFRFRPGCSRKASSTVATPVQARLDVTLRHNDIQEALYRRLAAQYGREKVGTEIASGVGTSIDVVVCRDKEYWFYEIKTASSPRACLREALGQLLEYAFWPGAKPATRLVVVGEGEMDDDAAHYLSQLRQRFGLPIEYEQISP